MKSRLLWLLPKAQKGVESKGDDGEDKHSKDADADEGDLLHILEPSVWLLLVHKVVLLSLEYHIQSDAPEDIRQDREWFTDSKQRQTNEAVHVGNTNLVAVLVVPLSFRVLDIGDASVEAD